MTYSEINDWLANEKRKTTERQARERTDMYARHQEEKDSLMQQWRDMMSEFRSQRGTDAPASTASRVAKHNKELKAITTAEKLRTQLGFTATSAEGLVDELKQRIEVLRQNYFDAQVPKEQAKATKKESLYRTAIVQLGGAVTDIPFIHVSPVDVAKARLATPDPSTPLPVMPVSPASKELDPQEHARRVAELNERIGLS